MCEIIAVANQKGGAGKTTTTKNLGRALAEDGKKVLEVDFDPQFSLSTSLGYTNTDSEQFTIGDLMDRAIEMKELPGKEEYIKHTEHFDILLSNIVLSSTELKLVGIMEREYILKSILDELREDYDYILIDCNPSLGMLVINALAACDSIIIPVDSNYLASKGLELFLRTFIRILKRINTKLYIKGILLTKFNGLTNISKKTFRNINEAYGSGINIFSTKIPTSVKVGESDDEGLSIIDFAPENPVALAYKELAKEVISYVGQ